MTGLAELTLGMVPSDADPVGRRVMLMSAGSARFTEPFFDHSLAKLASAGRVRTRELSFDDLRAAIGDQKPSPLALILHTGRCGSTLLMRMLLHERSIMGVAEPAAIGSLHYDALSEPARRATDEQAWLDLLVTLDRFAAGRGQRTVVKLSSWSAIAAPRLLDLLPDVPAVFMYRDVLSVVASQMHGPPSWAERLLADQQALARWVPHVRGLREGAEPPELYAALWASAVTAALEAPSSRLVFLPYQDLVDRPSTTLASIAGHARMAASWNRDTALAELRYYAKAQDPSEEFEPDRRHARPPLAADTTRRILEIAGDLPSRLVARAGGRSDGRSGGDRRGGDVTTVEESSSQTPHPSEPSEPTSPTFHQPGEGTDVRLVATGELPLGIALTLPRSGASALEDRLAAANASARRASLERLATWLPGYDFDEAVQNVDARRFAVMQLGDALQTHLRGNEMVDRLLFDYEHHWGLGGVTFSHEDAHGHSAPPPFATYPSSNDGRGRLHPGGLSRALLERWTAIINNADRMDARLSDVNMDLTRIYGSPVNTNIYISFGPAKGFGAHWDSHDTFIVPVRGAKRWALFEPGVLSAQRPWIDAKVSERPLWEGVIEPGMALFIPRGWGHRVDGSDDLSIHCTIGVNRLEVHNLLERVSFEAGFWPLMRADVPFDVREPVTSYGGSVFDDPRGFARTVSEVAAPELIERGVASHRARIVRRSRGTLECAFKGVALEDWSGLALRLTAPAGVMVVAEDDDHVVLAFSDQAVRLATDAVDAFTALADCAPRAVSDLPPIGTGPDRRAEFATQLVSSGLAVVESRP